MWKKNAIDNSKKTLFCITKNTQKFHGIALKKGHFSYILLIETQKNDTEEHAMSFRKGIKDALYFTVGAVAVGLETLADAADKLTEKGADVVKHGKEVFEDFCKKCEIPDDEEPAVVIEEDLEGLSDI